MLDILFKTDVGLYSLAAFTAMLASGVVALILAWRRLRDTSDQDMAS